MDGNLVAAMSMSMSDIALEEMKQNSNNQNSANPSLAAPLSADLLSADAILSSSYTTVRPTDSLSHSAAAASSSLFCVPLSTCVQSLLPSLTSDNVIHYTLQERTNKPHSNMKKERHEDDDKDMNKETERDKVKAKDMGQKQVAIELSAAVTLLTGNSQSHINSSSLKRWLPDALVPAISELGPPAAPLCQWFHSISRRFVKYVRSPISFRYTLLALVTVPLVLACVIIWWLGYNAAQSIADDLSEQLRDANIEGMNERVSSELQKPLLAAQLLAQSLAILRPDWGNASTVDVKVLALLQQQLYLYIPQSWISSLIVSSYAGGFTMMAMRHMNLTTVRSAGDVIEDPSVSPSDEFIDVVYSDSHTLLVWLQPSLNSSQWSAFPIFRFSSSPNSSSSSALQLLEQSMTGWSDISGALLSPWGVVSDALMETNWTGPQYNDPSFYAGTKQLQMSAILSLSDINGKFIGWLSVGILLSLIDETLVQLSKLGPHGLAFVARSDGLLLAASVAIPGAPEFPFYINSDQAANTSLPTIAIVLAQQGFMSATPTVKLDLSRLLSANIITNAALKLGGGAYHMSATVINLTGLNWVLVAVTSDDDWNGSVKTQTLWSIIVTVVVVVVAAACALISSFFILMPMTNLAAFMRAISAITNRKRNLSSSLAISTAPLSAVPMRQSNQIPRKPTHMQSSNSDSNCASNSYSHVKAIHPLSSVGATKEQMQRQIRAVFDTPRNVHRKEPEFGMDINKVEQLPSQCDSQSRTVYEELKMLCDMWKQVEKKRIRSPLKSVIAPPQTAQNISNESGSGNMCVTSVTTGSQMSSLTFPLSVRSVDSQHCGYFLREISEMESTFKSMLWKLRSSYSKAEKANEARKHFIRYIFHEVRVPLNAMLLAIQHLKEQVPNNTNQSHTHSHSHKQMNNENMGSNGNAYSPGGPPPRNVSATFADPEMAGIIDILHEQANVVVGILNDVLCLQKIEDGRLALDFTEFSLANLLVSTCESFFAVFESKRIDLFSQLHPSLYSLYSPIIRAALEVIQHNSGISAARAETLLNECGAVKRDDQLRSFFQVFGDRSRVRQVLANFLSNACKFTPSGGAVRIDVEVAPLQRSPPGFFMQLDSLQAASPTAAHGRLHVPAVLRISVSDNGCGMSGDDAALLFSDKRDNKFVQVGSGAKMDSNKVGGSGLGLGISKKLIELHNGVIGVTSKIDGGSTFYFAIPTILSINIQTLNHFIVSLENESDAKESRRQHHLNYNISTPDVVPLSQSMSECVSSGRITASQLSASPNFVSKSTRDNVNARGGERGGPSGNGSGGEIDDSEVSAVQYHYDSDDERHKHLHNLKQLQPDHALEQIMEADEQTPLTMQNVAHTDTRNSALNSDLRTDLDPGARTATDAGAESPDMKLSVPSVTALAAPFSGSAGSSKNSFFTSDSPLAMMRGLGGSPLRATARGSISRAPPALHVIVVEDSLPNRKLLTMSLKKLNYRVTAFEDGTDVVKFFTDMKETELKKRQLNAEVEGEADSSEVVLPTTVPMPIGSQPASLELLTATPVAEKLPPILQQEGPMANPTATAVSASVVPSSSTSYDSVSGSTSSASSAAASQSPSSGSTTSGLVSHLDVDVVLMDSNMPKMSGLSATRAIRALGYTASDLPVVGVTGNALSEDIEEFLASGANAILTKPIQMNELNKLIQALCGRKEKESLNNWNVMRPDGVTKPQTIRRMRSQSVVML